MVADSERDANMLYATGLFVPDPFIYLRTTGRPLMVMSDLEIDRARAQAPHCRVASLSQYQQKLRDRGIKRPGLAHVVWQILREKGIRRVTVPDNFPLGLATDLEKLGVSVKARPGNFFPEREIKSAAEVRKISAALVMAEVGMAEAMQVLRTAKIGRDRKLLYHNVPLTSENCARSLTARSCRPAAGRQHHRRRRTQACDPHERGYGPLRAHEPIIIDIFRVRKKPVTLATSPAPSCVDAPVKPRENLRHGLSGQKIAFRKIRANAPTGDVHRAVHDFFEQQGYKTRRHHGRMEGFFHGTGHGLGLEIHESPRVGANPTGTLKPGHVVTVEPGLYYPEIGGVRLEDVALVTTTARAT